MAERRAKKTSPARFYLSAAAVLALWGAATAVRAQEGYFELRGAIHIHSRFSTGRESLEEIARLAMAHGVEVLIVSDDDLLEIDYGIPFLRCLVRGGRKVNAIFSSGKLGAYLAEIERLDRLYPELIIIDGIESAPFYFWEIDLAAHQWTVHNWNKHLLTLNLRREEAYAHLPVIGGEGNRIWHWTSLLGLWPLAGVLYFLLACRRGRRPYAVLVLSLLFLIDNFPFKVPISDPYHGDLGAAPYQYYIDYVNDHGGMVFWPHPKARSSIAPQSMLKGLLKVVSYTPPHAGDLVQTYNYQGFAALYGDDITATDPGAEWDQVLAQYLEGRRARPVWGTGEIDYHYAEQKDNQIHDILTVFLVRERTRAAVLDALRQGRIYAVRGGDEQLVLKRFSVDTGVARGLAGEEVPSRGEARVAIQIDKLDGSQEKVRVRLIKAGEVVADFEGTTPLEFQHIDTGIRPGEKTYYRLLARSRRAWLTSNPIFVTGESSP